jgi:hypothetical protein
VTTYLSYTLLIMFGRFREMIDWVIKPARRPPAGYAPLVADWEDFFQRRLYQRIVDCWNRPVASCPGAWMDVVEVCVALARCSSRGRTNPTDWLCCVCVVDCSARL